MFIGIRKIIYILVCVCYYLLMGYTYNWFWISMEVWLRMSNCLWIIHYNFVHIYSCRILCTLSLSR